MPTNEWDHLWSWWSHEVWMEIYIYDMLFEAAWVKFQIERKNNEQAQSFRRS